MDTCNRLNVENIFCRSQERYYGGCCKEPKGHPYIAKMSGVCGGRSIVEGTRIPVWSLIKWYKLGFSVEDIMREFPQLHPSQVYDAFSYYYDHQEEIEHDIRENEDEDSFRKMTA